MAGIGSCLLEFAALSSLTDDLKYVDAARRCMVRLYELRSPYDMVGKHVNIRQETWTEQASCLGRNSDSYYEYLVKGYILLNDPQLFDMFMTLYYAIDVYNKVNRMDGGLNHRIKCIGMKCRASTNRRRELLSATRSLLFGQAFSF